MELPKIDDILNGSMNDAYSIEVVTKAGRKFRYTIGKFVLQVRASDERHHLELLVEQAMAEKLKECEWDRSHPQVVDSEEAIREVLLEEFLDYQRWLKKQASK